MSGCVTSRRCAGYGAFGLEEEGGGGGKKASNHRRLRRGQTSAERSDECHQMQVIFVPEWEGIMHAAGGWEGGGRGVQWLSTLARPTNQAAAMPTT